jgi:hypothetical protein
MADHPITPPCTLVRDWLNEFELGLWPGGATLHVATQAARWGADQELEACCEWQNLFNSLSAGNLLRAARRSKPKSRSLKEQALEDLSTLRADLERHGLGVNTDNILRALEALHQPTEEQP